MSTKKLLVAGVPLAFAILAVPLAGSAQSAGDQAYCHALADVWRAYNRGQDPAATIATAITQCNRNPAAGIPVIEKALTDDKIRLPART